MSARAPVRVKTLTIDGREVGAREDQTILEVARENDIFIPTLCDLAGPEQRGRLPAVHRGSEGRQQAAPGLRHARRGGHGGHGQLRAPGAVPPRHSGTALRRAQPRLLASASPTATAICRSLALKLGMTHVHFPYQYPRLPVDASHERFVVDHNRCILCTRCVRVCDEIEGAHTWDIMARGVECRVITDLAQPWGRVESCTGCGKCVQVCPTGALSEKGRSVAEMSKRRQFLPYLTLMREGRR